jgi:hypothetical protein
MDVKEMTRDNLEHEAIQAQIKIISAQITANFDVIGEQLNGILAQAKKTNGRVTRLEDITNVLDVMQRNKWLTVLVIYAIYNLLELTTIDNVLKFIRIII